MSLNKSAFHIPSLDGLRAISFMLVFVAHAGLGDKVPAGLGVTVFFFLSGYLITTLMRMEMEKSGTVSMRAFYLRRALRILPPMYVVLLGAYLIAGLGLLTDGPLTLGAGIAQALHLTNYWLIATWSGTSGTVHGTGVMWSLAIEEHFYLFYPIIFVALTRKYDRSKSAKLLLAVCGLVLLWRLVLIAGMNQPPMRTYYGTDTRIDSILFGCILGLVGNPVLDRPWLSQGMRWPALLGGLGLLLVSLIIREPVFQAAGRYTTFGIALFPLFTLAILYPKWWPFRILNTKPVAYVGVISYGLYLIHHVVIFTLTQQLPSMGPIPRGALAFAVSLGLASFMYKYLEKPCARLRKRLSTVESAPASESVALAAPAVAS